MGCLAWFATRWCLACSHVGFISPISMVNFWWIFWGATPRISCVPLASRRFYLSWSTAVGWIFTFEKEMCWIRAFCRKLGLKMGLSLLTICCSLTLHIPGNSWLRNWRLLAATPSVISSSMIPKPSGKGTSWFMMRERASHISENESCLRNSKLLSCRMRFAGDFGGILPFTLWLFNIAMENGPFIDGLPIKNCGSFHGKRLVNQMVDGSDPQVFPIFGDISWHIVLAEFVSAEIGPPGISYSTVDAWAGCVVATGPFFLWWFGTCFIVPYIYIWECHHPNWRTNIFQRGRSTTNQVDFPKPDWGWWSNLTNSIMFREGWNQQLG